MLSEELKSRGGAEGYNSNLQDINFNLVNETRHVVIDITMPAPVVNESEPDNSLWEHEEIAGSDSEN